MLSLDEFTIARAFNQIEFATQAAARCAAIGNALCSTPTATKTYAANLVTITIVPSSAFTVAAAACGTQVTASYS